LTFVIGSLPERTHTKTTALLRQLQSDKRQETVEASSAFPPGILSVLRTQSLVRTYGGHIVRHVIVDSIGGIHRIRICEKLSGVGCRRVNLQHVCQLGAGYHELIYLNLGACGRIREIDMCIRSFFKLLKSGALAERGNLFSIDLSSPF
jgi:hypothetical protein